MYRQSGRGSGGDIERREKGMEERDTDRSYDTGKHTVKTCEILLRLLHNQSNCSIPSSIDAPHVTNEYVSLWML